MLRRLQKNMSTILIICLKNEGLKTWQNYADSGEVKHSE